MLYVLTSICGLASIVHMKQFLHIVQIIFNAPECEPNNELCYLCQITESNFPGIINKVLTVMFATFYWALMWKALY